MSIEEVEQILDETQEAVEYQRVGVGPGVHEKAEPLRLPT